MAEAMNRNQQPAGAAPSLSSAAAGRRFAEPACRRQLRGIL